MQLKQDGVYNAEVDLDDMEYNEGSSPSVIIIIIILILHNIFFFYEIETKSYSMLCRCSGNYIITVQDLENGENITGCTNCSLNIHVLYEIIDE
jgi:diphthamide biosynthesis protein 4